MTGSARTVAHETFTVERTYRQAPGRVFAAFADPARKRRWFAEGEGFTVDSYELDLREGGRERCVFRWQDGPPVVNETVFHDVVRDRRIVLVYTMLVDGKRISTSIGTTELLPEGKGTRLVYTEQTAFLDGAEKMGSREGGTKGLLEALAQELDARS